MSPKEELYRLSLTYAQSNVVTLVNMWTTVFWDVTPYNIVAYRPVAKR
jgi:hypothetical protein